MNDIVNGLNDLNIDVNHVDFVVVEIDETGYSLASRHGYEYISCSSVCDVTRGIKEWINRNTPNKIYFIGVFMYETEYLCEQIRGFTNAEFIVLNTRAIKNLCGNNSGDLINSVFTLIK